MKTQQVLEYSEPGVRGSVIVGVKVTGTKSRNGREYPLDVLREAIPLYEDAPVYLNHGDAREKRQGSRRHKDHFGSLERAFVDGKGLFANLRVKRSHGQAKRILETAATGKFGLSHDVIVKMTDDEKTVTEIIEVNSVDLVNNPATTQNLFEGSDMTDTAIAEPKPDEKPGFDVPKLIADLEKLHGRLDALEALKPKPVTEGEGKKPVKRLTALEERTVEEGEEPKIGNTHEDFLAHLRGFSLTNTKGASA